MSHEEVVVVGIAFRKEKYVDHGQDGTNQEEEGVEHMENRREQEDPKGLELLNKGLAIAHQLHTVEKDRHQKEDNLDLVVEELEVLGVQ